MNTSSFSSDPPSSFEINVWNSQVSGKADLNSGGKLPGTASEGKLEP